MTDSSNQAKPKIVDFGLAKIIGPNETADEPFGTFGYVAPEVLKKKPYTFSCDVWSIGCIVFELYHVSPSLSFAASWIRTLYHNHSLSHKKMRYQRLFERNRIAT